MDFIEVKDCKKCVHVKSEMNPNYFGGCEFCFRRNDLVDFYFDEKKEIDFIEFKGLSQLAKDLEGLK